MVKNPPANAGDTVPSLGQEDPLEDEMATHSRILARRIPWTEEQSRTQLSEHPGAQDHTLYIQGS